MLTTKFLKDIMTEARPIVERQLDDAELVAGLRDVFTAQGGDWGALKALIKSQIQDERDEAGDGKRIRKIRERAGNQTAYADMLGLGNMNEENYIPGHDPETGEIQESAAVASSLRSEVVTPSSDESVTPIQPETASEAPLPGKSGGGELKIQPSSPAPVLTFTSKPRRPYCQHPQSCHSGEATKHCWSCDPANPKNQGSAA